jgi:hypothetical protein
MRGDDIGDQGSKLIHDLHNWASLHVFDGLKPPSPR